MSESITYNSSFRQSLTSKSLEVCILLSLFIIVYLTNSLFPIYLDDWPYSRMMDGSEITSIGDIIKNQYHHYFAWGGRSLVHTFAQILLYMGKPWCDIVNAMAYVLFVWVIYRIVTLNKNRNILYLLIIHCYIWFLTPSLGECIFWKTGSANYLWGTLLIVSFIYMYASHYINGSNKKKYTGIIIFFFGILAGWTNENMVVALLIFLIVLMLLLKIERRPVPQWMLLGLVGAAIGATFMLAAPGNLIRYSASDITEGEPTYQYLFYRSISTIKQFSWYCLWPTVIYIIISIIHYKLGFKDKKRVISKLSYLLFCTAMIATIAMIAAPIFPERVWFGIISLILIATMLLYANLNFTFKGIKTINYIITFGLIILFGISFAQGYKHLEVVDQIWKDRTESVISQKEKHIKNAIIVGKYEADMRMLSLPKVSDIKLDSIEWIGRAYGKYLGIESVTLIDSITINRVKDSISMTVIPDTYSINAKSIEVTVTNNTTSELLYGNNYTIEYLDNEKGWVKQPNNFLINDLLHILQPNKSRISTVYICLENETNKAGTYRILKEFYTEGKEKEYSLSANFYIKE